MLYNPKSELAYLAGLQHLENSHRAAIDEMTTVYLKANCSIEPGLVLEVAPRPKQYFSRSKRFLVVQVVAHVGRDKGTGAYAGVLVSAKGVFLKEDGTAFQSPTQDSRYFHTESLALKNSKYLAADPNRLAEDQTHQIPLPE